MSSRWELDDGIKSIKSAWQREHTARANLEKMLENAETENDRLRELLVGAFEDMDAWQRVIAGSNEWGYGKGCLDRLCKLRDAMQELGMEVVVG